MDVLKAKLSDPNVIAASKAFCDQSVLIPPEQPTYVKTYKKSD